MMEFSNFLIKKFYCFASFLSAAAFPPQLKFCNNELGISTRTNETSSFFAAKSLSSVQAVRLA